jgi:phage terminase small subunit
MKKSSKTSRPNRRDKERYRRFAEAYLDIGNPETYLKAKPSAIIAGYSKSYAHGRSYELLDRVGVQKEIKQIRDSRFKRSTIATPEEVLEALTQQLRTLPNELVNPMTGDLISLKDMTRDQAAAIAAYKVKQRTYQKGETPVTEDTIEYKLVDRLKAAEMLARHHGIFEKRSQQKPSSENASLVAYPSGELTLEEWQAQVVAILAGAKQVQNPTAPKQLPDHGDTSAGT